jgi:hypothetical protein
MNIGEKDDLMEDVPYFGSLEDREKKKNAPKPKRKKKEKPYRALTGTLFKIWCWTYEVIDGDSMPIRQEDINRATDISIPSIHHAWNDEGKTSKSHINHIVAKLPEIVKELIEKKYSRMTSEQREELLQNKSLTPAQRKDLLTLGYLSPEQREILFQNAPMLTKEELDEKTKMVITF